MRNRAIGVRQLATYIGVSPSTVSALRRGAHKTPEVGTLMKLAEYFNVDFGRLAHYADAPTEVPTGDGPSVRRPPLAVLRELENYLREAPILVPEVEQSASAGSFAGYDDVELWPFWPRRHERDHDFLTVRASGDCLAPRLQDGERVVVDLTEKPDYGKIVLALHEGKHILKILEREGGRTVLQSLDGRPSIPVTEATRILGVAKQKIERL